MVSRVLVLVLAMVVFVVNPVAAGAKGTVSAADTAILDAALLTINDFPPGWTESPDAASSSTPNLSKYGTVCSRLQRAADRAKKLQSVRRESSDFNQGEIDSINNSAAVFRTAAAARTAFDIMERPAVAGCLKKAVTARLKRSAAASGVRYTARIGKLFLPPVGDASTAYEFVISVKARNVTLAVYLDLQLVQVGRTGLTFSFEGQLSPLAADQQALVQRVVDRVRAAQAGG
jgi:hypothetical protein